MKTETDISIVTPIYNEEKNIDELYSRLTNTLKKQGLHYEIIFINDGSKDNSLVLIKQLSKSDPYVKYINFSRNFGHQVAISAGIDNSAGNSVAIIDSDLQDPPELIEDLYKKYLEGFKVVYAKRKSRKGESIFKKATAKVFYRVLSRITSVDIPIDTGDFRLIDRVVVDHLKQMPEQKKFLRGQIAWLGYSQAFVEFDRDARVQGETGYSFKKMFNLAIDGITSFSNFPLRMVTLFGFLVSFISFLIILYALYSKFILKTAITGWTSLMISTIFIGGVQLFSIGIIGEYINRINHDSMKRPLYVVEETNI
ncbi:MAG: glycosyltransferase [Bacteroidetes bacterium GWC2_33_15]|nr:MAG: glycosyltransferase [Bacteroidetes bacterium GWA2_33_15]OFX48963.1 MAG: glycosyltransferase [Bacteroidetes bacterium GWC2_33_15]OFX64773.1 MAG: glycosyltransferase [Bacteroidetes bacterium GWB2_32_14]OFX68475.1 MAG: glycosyltransferase [Bacteroidetes bacterium GWD2_33_33]HAN19200.1 glycosyltransferase [Bacteroidales bacterium]